MMTQVHSADIADNTLYVNIADNTHCAGCVFSVLIMLMGGYSQTFFF